MAESELTNGRPESNLESRYVKLDPKVAQYMLWSNDPHDLDLYGAFKDKEPNLSSDFNVKGLKPILRDMGSDKFILRDAQEFYYLWSPWEGHLWRVGDAWTKDEELDGSIEDIVEHLMVYYPWIQEEAHKVVKNYVTGSFELIPGEAAKARAEQGCSK